MYVLFLSITTKNGVNFTSSSRFKTEDEANQKGLQHKHSIMRTEGAKFCDYEFFSIERSIVRKSEVESCEILVRKAYIGDEHD